MLGLFGNMLSADHMISPHNRDKFPQQDQTPLSQRVKMFAEILFLFSKST